MNRNNQCCVLTCNEPADTTLERPGYIIRYCHRHAQSNEVHSLDHNTIQWTDPETRKTAIKNYETRYQ